MTRQSGRSFRVILQSLLCASRGKRVIVISHSDYASYNLFTRASEIIRLERVQIAKFKRCCISIGEGSITFMTLRDWENHGIQKYAGFKDIKTITDL